MNFGIEIWPYHIIRILSKILVSALLLENKYLNFAYISSSIFASEVALNTGMKKGLYLMI